MRIDDWESALAAVLRRHAMLPFGYGTSDCYLVCADAALAVTGTDPYPAARRYRTEAGAAKALRAHGFETVVEAWAAKFREVPRAQVMRGDICVVETALGAAGAVWSGREAFTKSPDGNVLLGLSDVSRVLRVE